MSAAVQVSRKVSGAMLLAFARFLEAEVDMMQRDLMADPMRPDIKPGHIYTFTLSMREEEVTDG